MKNVQGLKSWLENVRPVAGLRRLDVAATSIAVLALAGCAGKATPEYSGVTAKPVIKVVAAKPAVKSATAPQPVKPTGVPVVPKSLNFVQKGLHNCGTVAMLLSWAKLHPREAATIVRRQNNGAFAVRFANGNTIQVGASELRTARRLQVVKCSSSDRWPEIVLTAFAKALTEEQASTTGLSTPALDFSTIEWISASDIGSRLSGRQFNFFEIKPETQDKAGRVQVGAPVSVEVLEQQLRAMKGRPATAYTNRRIHIWAVLDYDMARKRVYARNPRRAEGEWMSLREFRQRFQLLVYAMDKGNANAVQS